MAAVTKFICETVFEKCVFRVALAMDGLILNGIEFGIVNQAFPGFFDNAVRNYLDELMLFREEIDRQQNVDMRMKGDELSIASRRLVENLELLRGFREMPVQRLQSTIANVREIRNRCVEVIQALESIANTTARFYTARSIGSTKAIDEFLINLPVIFSEASQTNVNKSNPKNFTVPSPTTPSVGEPASTGG